MCGIEKEIEDAAHKLTCGQQDGWSDLCKTARALSATLDSIREMVPDAPQQSPFLVAVLRSILYPSADDIAYDAMVAERKQKGDN